MSWVIYYHINHLNHVQVSNILFWKALPAPISWFCQAKVNEDPDYVSGWHKCSEVMSSAPRRHREAGHTANSPSELQCSLWWVNSSQNYRQGHGMISQKCQLDCVISLLLALRGFPFRTRLKPIFHGMGGPWNVSLAFDPVLQSHVLCFPCTLPTLSHTVETYKTLHCEWHSWHSANAYRCWCHTVR